jgi:hypothetical protein
MRNRGVQRIGIDPSHNLLGQNPAAFVYRQMRNHGKSVRVPSAEINS